MSDKRNRKAKRKPKKKQRRSILDRLYKIAAVAYWIIRLVLLLVDWFKK